jgi:hypothetical protein
MTSIATDTTDDVCCEVALLGTVILAMTNLTTILARLIFIVAERSV